MICNECETVAHCTSHGCIPKQPTQQKPVATVTSESGNPDVLMSWWHEPALPIGTKLYTSPPTLSLAHRQARSADTWVGLTQQDIDIAFDDTREGGGFDDFARAIEAKLKAKNSP